MGKKILSITTIVVILCACILRIVFVNINYVRPSKTVYSKGQECVYKSISYRIVSRDIYNNEDDLTPYLGNGNWGENIYDTRYLMIGLDVTYTGEEEQINFSVSGMHIQTGASTNGIIEAGNQSHDKVLERGETKRMYIMAKLPATLFSRASWKNLDTRNYEFVLSTYPDIIIMECQ